MFHKRVRTVTRLDADQSYGTHDRETPCLVHVNISVYVSTYNYYEDLYSPLKWQHKLQKKTTNIVRINPKIHQEFALYFARPHTRTAQLEDYYNAT